jgi:hypothetical protein
MPDPTVCPAIEVRTRLDEPASHASYESRLATPVDQCPEATDLRIIRTNLQWLYRSSAAAFGFAARCLPRRRRHHPRRCREPLEAPPAEAQKTSGRRITW